MLFANNMLWCCANQDSFVIIITISIIIIIIIIIIIFIIVTVIKNVIGIMIWLIL